MNDLDAMAIRDNYQRTFDELEKNISEMRMTAYLLETSRPHRWLWVNKMKAKRAKNLRNNIKDIESRMIANGLPVRNVTATK